MSSPMTDTLPTTRCKAIMIAVQRRVGHQRMQVLAQQAGG
jgi:hypothetical protein